MMSSDTKIDNGTQNAGMGSSAPTSRASRGRARLGIVVPFSNTNLEPDMQMLRPNGVSLHFARAGGYDLDEVPDSEQMRQFALASLEEVVTSLAATRPDVLLYGCTSATLAHGLPLIANLPSK